MSISLPHYLGPSKTQTSAQLSQNLTLDRKNSNKNFYCLTNCKTILNPKLLDFQTYYKQGKDLSPKQSRKRKQDIN